MTWLRGQGRADGGADLEAIACILTGAISHYRAMSDDAGERPFGIEEERYLAAITDVATASLNR